MTIFFLLQAYLKDDPVAGAIIFASLQTHLL